MDMFDESNGFIYSGDVNLVHGGYFLPMDWQDQCKEYGSIDALMVNDIYDIGNEVLFIHSVTIDIPMTDNDCNEVLSIIGRTVKDLPTDEKERALWIIEACLSYEKYHNQDYTYLATNYDKDYSELSDIVTNRIDGESNEEIVAWLRDNGWL